jgi:3',5'-cyclic AMP phosphodiesterase CpdA
MASSHKKLVLIADPHVWPSESSSQRAMVQLGSRRGALGSYSRAYELEHLAKAIASRYDPRHHVVVILGDIVEGAWSAASVDEEYANAAHALRPLSERGFGTSEGDRGPLAPGHARRVLHMVPGNHDIGVRGNEFYLGPRLRPYARERYLHFHERHCGYRTTFPHVEDYGAWKLVLLDSTGYHDGRATPRSWARGRIGPAQLGDLRAVLESDARPTVVALHHHPRMRRVGSRTFLAIEDIEEFDQVLTARRGPVMVCCGHKHVEDLRLRSGEGPSDRTLGAIALGQCTDDLRVIMVDPVRQSVDEVYEVPLALPGEATLRGGVHVRSTPMNGSRRDEVHHDQRMARGCIVTSVHLEHVDSRGRVTIGPARKIESGLAETAGALIAEDEAGSNDTRVTVRTWGMRYRYRIVYGVRATGGAPCTLGDGVQPIEGPRGDAGSGETLSLVDRLRTRGPRQPSRQTTVFNDRRLASGCTVVRVELERLDARDRRIQGPAQKITMAPLEIGGAILVEDAVGTDSLRVAVRTWNGSPTHQLRYRLVYTVRRSGGAACRL